MMNTGRRVLVLIATLALVVTACGGDDADGAATELEVTASEFEFSPSSYEVAANTELSITFTNDGSIEHEWVIMKSPIDDESQFEEDLVLWEEEAEAGESKTATIPALDPGTYQIICGLDGHFTAGMEGELVAVDS
jgi:plastocyanin